MQRMTYFAGSKVFFGQQALGAWRQRQFSYRKANESEDGYQPVG